MSRRNRDTIIFMGDRVRDAFYRGSRVIVQDSPTSRRRTNMARFYVDGRYIGQVRFTQRPHPAVRTHEVRAWVELAPHVEVRVRKRERKS